MYEDRDRLSYMYADGMVFCEDTTLFALWQEKGSAALPLVYVSAEGVSWDGAGTAVSASTAMSSMERILFTVGPPRVFLSYTQHTGCRNRL